MNNSKTLNFNVESDPKLQCTCSDPRCDKRCVSQSVLNDVQKIRNEVARPLSVTSAGRCPHHPNEVHRSSPADHQKCLAVDIACANGFERGEIVSLGIKHGFNAIGVHKDFVHLGKRKNQALVIWTY